MKPSAVDHVVHVEPRFTFGSFRLDADGTLLHQGSEVHLPLKELAALRLLLIRSGQIVSLHELRNELWGDVHVTADSVPRCISSLRAHMQADDCIQTVYKQGYRFTLPVEQDNGSVAAGLPRLAIVPFACGPGVPEHLGEAVAEGTTAKLTALDPPLLAMLARESVFTLTRKGMTALQVGEMLHGDLVLTGTVQALPAHLRLRAEMVRVKDGTQIWVEDVLVARERAAGLETELMERLLFRVVGRIVPAEGQEAAFSAEAYDMFLRGRYEWQTLEPRRMEEGMRHLRRAAEIDGRLMQAQVEMARACVAQELFGHLSPRVAAEQVRQIASEFPEGSAHRQAILPASGWMAFHVGRDLETAQHFFGASAHLGPDSWRSRLRALFALSRHRFDESADMLREALELDPCSPWLNASLAWVYHLAGSSADSMVQMERCLDICPEHTAARLYGGIILAFNGAEKRALSLTRELTLHAPHFDLAMAVHAYVLACNGNAEEAGDWLRRLGWLSRERFTIRSFSAAAYLQLGDRDAALAELRAADEDRCPWFFQLLADPRLAGLRDEPEFQRLQARLGEMETTPGRAAPEWEGYGICSEVNR
jgi:DNA-binding winged helix-turn-helix (wHTH) protein/tetratricopeptide (TPR) repeat protein